MIKKLTIDRFEGEEAILKTEDGRAARLPKDLLPADKSEGTVLHMLLMAEGEAGDEKKQLAKAILNEIIGGDYPDKD